MADLCFEEVVLNVVAPCPLCMGVSGVAERMEERECLFLGSPDALCKPSVGREYKTLEREMGGCREGNCYLPKRDGSFSRSQGVPRNGCLSKNVPWKWSSLGTDVLLCSRLDRLPRIEVYQVYQRPLAMGESLPSRKVGEVLFLTKNLIKLRLFASWKVSLCVFTPHAKL